MYTSSSRNEGSATNGKTTKMKTNSKNQNRIAVTGNTYPVKDQIKALGARWDADAGAWMVSEDKAAEARRIVAGAGPKKAFSGGRSFGARGNSRRPSDSCELCGRNRYTCGHCIGW